MLVSDLLEMPSLGLTLVHDAGAAHARIRWVHTSELPEPARYLSGGELVLTNGLWRTDDAAADRFAASLAQAGVAGLGFGEESVGAGVPNDVVEACRRHEVTLLQIPHLLPYMEIARAHVDSVHAHEDEGLRWTVNAHELLTDLVAGNHDTESLLEEIGRSAGLTVTALIDEATCVGAGPPGLERDALWRRLESTHSFPAVLTVASDRRIIGIRLSPSDQPSAYLVGIGTRSAIDARTLALLRAAAPYVALELAPRIAAVAAARAEDERILRELLDHGVRDEALTTPLPERSEWCAVALRPLTAHPGPSDWIVLRQEFRAFAPDAIWAVLDDALLALVPAHGDFVDLHQELGAALHDAVGAIAPVESDAEFLAAAMRDARHVAHQVDPSTTVRLVRTVDELGHRHRLLTSDRISRTAFTRHQLDPLRRHDRLKGSRLLDTLGAFVESDRNYSVAAERLHVHVNTLRYRLDQIVAIGGPDPRTAEGFVDAFLALELSLGSTWKP